MPYIKKERREAIGLGSTPQNAGELNFIFTVICIKYLEEHGLTYAHLNDVMGALDGASKELYRRVAVPYEEQKIAENGDLFRVEVTNENKS